MNKILFSNVALAQTTLAAVHQILDDPQALLRWVPDVKTVTRAADSFNVSRSSSALNDQENIRVERSENKVRYISTGGRLSYQLLFTLTAENGRVAIQEDLLVDETANRHFPLRLLAPIAKQAFNENLNRLVGLIETAV
ncbi:SRPBCC family protein [Lapidilactobacillus bayanensis]|uniref:SRPBCC family protein n=1 Tax=Lapidilactobacillus bayanensis TaxID=2485998 RepID=UPI001CDBC2D0|nr:SRPBCC family protein [Lapidilactobacillus bayanensis]